MPTPTCRATRLTRRRKVTQVDIPPVNHAAPQSFPPTAPTPTDLRTCTKSNRPHPALQTSPRPARHGQPVRAAHFRRRLITLQPASTTTIQMGQYKTTPSSCPSRCGAVLNHHSSRVQPLMAHDMKGGLRRLGVCASGASFVFLEFHAAV